jgi:hypothetical protein
MVVALEKAKITEQQLSVQAGSNTELQNQLDILRNTIKLYEDQIAVYKNMQDMNAKMGDMKDKACQEQIKAATPTFMDKLKSDVLAGGVGAVLAVIVIIAFHL